eukprot:TRINITY_DN10705_c0_g3_i2.p1 TRINITY_DN10705_c0_g3~~TRINITY_DN10705_c0_g3_i2.p1  ORF type:complete len:111 (-),score=20.79 TRINITY_DN10705_c0_g3_i2:532-864(-)
MYLSIVSKSEIPSNSIFTTFSLICFSIASKVSISYKTQMEGGKTEVIEYTPDIAALEKYILTFLLKWKMAYITPYNYVQALSLRFYNKHEAALIIAKATRISELLLMCTQ